MVQLKIVNRVSRIQQLRANSRFFFDSYRKCIDNGIDPSNKYGNLQIPGVVNLLFSIELILKLVIHTETYLKDKANYDSYTTSKLMKSHNAEDLVGLIETPQIKNLIDTGNTKSVLKTESKNFLKLRYFYDFNNISIKNIGVLETFYVDCYTEIRRIHEGSDDNNLWSIQKPATKHLTK